MKKIPSSESIRDILVNTDKEYINQKGTLRYKHKVERSGMVYELSDTYSDEASDISSSRSHMELLEEQK